uniref:Allatostatins n=2 Tax=Diploptera punctata TaxID=6984 RepID=ALLS_DIPPU|nr:RecName: Full=Allatostatins; Contains: RecName: Full=Allatostatin-1; Short=AST1; Contains: RecName: Full=Allatostatin-2; Short=AST2; AltName: Full=ASA5; AltName: Full=ASB2; Contains: RecName: Full=Allatostatin-3; Short=AST3; Contains: RecName: Full=Allatostatin-4; Short=AST4; AltName: Full=ASA7; Contains: RecName: Full=Allatostatin-5; Short=AST5; AltName: Full=ASA4; Contains: RecName: Full=Allatostatin-6; Short=AST6; Contains: RecName: Full=Allatostatin-7; Short=AST7; AltName: Full=ASA1; Contain
MSGPRTCFCLPSALVLVLLSLSTSALGTAPEPSGVHEESPAGGGTDLLPHPEDLSASDNPDLEFVKRLYDFGLGKRAYSYVSEYKRLPVYNFGLGKRSKMYGFGLGKRDGRMYSFGLGKRDYDYYGEEDEDDQQAIGDEDIEESDVGDLMDKRDRLYSFGLGKRARPYSFGLGKRAPSGAQRLYGFGLGKRGGSLYSFGLGKRGDGRLYAFGLGKRPVNSGRSSGSRFNFGLGKRSDDIDFRELEEKFAEDKRYPQEHRFSFGLGKREVEPSELEAVRNEEKDNSSVHDKKNNTNDMHSGERIKRSLHYPFGIRKLESSYDLNSASSLNSEENDDITPEEFSRMVRRPFNFGLGKRIPMYDFGIGKRSER